MVDVVVHLVPRDGQVIAVVVRVEPCGKKLLGAKMDRTIDNTLHIHAQVERVPRPNNEEPKNSCRNAVQGSATSMGNREIQVQIRRGGWTTRTAYKLSGRTPFGADVNVRTISSLGEGRCRRHGPSES